MVTEHLTTRTPPHFDLLIELGHAEITNIK